MNATRDAALESRALRTLGESGEAIYQAAVDALRQRSASGAVADVGCGTGRLRALLDGIATSYVGVDAVRHEGFPKDAPLLLADLNREPIPLADRSADVVVSLETIEHLENPRAFCRELTRVARPGGGWSSARPTSAVWSAWERFCSLSTSPRFATTVIPRTRPHWSTPICGESLLKSGCRTSRTR